MTTWKAVCTVDDIPTLGSRRVSRPVGLDVAVFKNDAGEVFALLDRCPHKGGPLSQGIVFGTSVACPLQSTCPYCGVGCGVIIESHGPQITGVRGDPPTPPTSVACAPRAPPCTSPPAAPSRCRLGAAAPAPRAT
jgi:nitrite reductase (NADH) small subunit